MSLFVQDGRRAIDLFDRGGNFGGATAAAADGDVAAGDGTRRLFWDASDNTLELTDDEAVSLPADSFAAFMQENRRRMTIRNALSPVIQFERQRGTLAAPTTILFNEVIGDVDFRSYIGSTSGFVPTARICGVAHTTPPVDNVSAPTLLEFSTTEVGSLTRTARWRMEHDGHFTGAADNTYDLGATASGRPRTAFLGTSAVVASAVTVSSTGLASTAALTIGSTGALSLDSTTGAIETDATSLTADGAFTISSGSTDDAVTLKSGDNGAGDSGDVDVDAGSATGTAGTVTIAGTNAASLILGRGGLNVSVPGDLTVDGTLDVNGTVTTIDTTNLAVADVLMIAASGAATANEAGLAFERGSTGDDSLLLWNEASNRFELGLFDTTGGTTVPTGALGTLSDLRVNNLLLASTALTADGALTVTATGATLSLDGTALETSAASLTGDGAFTVAATGAALSLDGTGLETSATTLTADAGLSIVTTATGALSLDSGTTGAVSLGTGASAKTVSIGNATGATSVALDSGSGGITLTTAGGGSVTLLSDGIMSLDTGSGAIETDATSLTADAAFTLAATGAILSLDGTAIETSAASITGDAALTIGATGTLSLDSTTGAIATDATSLTADGALTIAATSAVLSLDGTALETSAASLTGDGAFTVAATGAVLSLDGTGIETAATTLTADAGLSIVTTTTGALSLDSGTTGAVGLGTGASAKTITIGNVTGATALVYNAGTGGHAFTGDMGFFGTAPIAQAAAITALTDSSGGTANDTIAAITEAANTGSADLGPTRDAIADLAAKVNAILTVLSGYGLTA